MTRLEKCEIIKSKGFTYDFETGEIYNKHGKLITKKSTTGYIVINGNTKFKGELYGHHFAWYMFYGNVDFEILDHINMDRSDNRITNLRIVSYQQNRFNTKAKGYCFKNNAWVASIGINGGEVYLGRYKTKEEAKIAYLEAKKIHHII
jgi:hypothetical protein